MMKKIIVGSDQMGFPLKEAVITYLKDNGNEVLDVGPFSDEDPVDYPDFAQLVTQKIQTGTGDFGIAICGTGIGMSIAANKVPGVRAALCHDVYTAHQARAHNDANVLCMGAWVVSPQRVGLILDEWLNTAYDQGRHQPRILKLETPLKEANTEEYPEFAPGHFQFGVALSPRETVFGPILFASQLEKGLEQAMDAGLDVVEISLRKPGDLSRDHLHSLLTLYNLRLSAIATGQSCLHDSMCLASTDKQSVQDAVSRLEEHIQFASEFGAAVIIGGVRGRLSGDAEAQREQRARALEAIHQCTQTAVEYGVQLLLEPINRYETNFINTAEEGVALIEEMGNPEVKLLLDTFHMNIEEANIDDTLNKFSNNLGYIHFADSNRLAPGWGHIPYHQVMKTLIKVGFRGVISAEILPLPDDASAMSQAGLFFKSLKPK